MEKEKKMEDKSEQKDVKDKKGQPLPTCTTASSPEHARADAEDEPCDDGRSGE